jgi:hypothetical protein
MLVLLTGGIYEVRRSDVLIRVCHDIHTKFHKASFRDFKLLGGRLTHADTQTNRQQGDLRSQFFLNKECRLKKKRE